MNGSVMLRDLDAGDDRDRRGGDLPGELDQRVQVEAVVERADERDQRPRRRGCRCIRSPIAPSRFRNSSARDAAPPARIARPPSSGVSRVARPRSRGLVDRADARREARRRAA